jgi:ankyrin repeat protein
MVKSTNHEAPHYAVFPNLTGILAVSNLYLDLCRDVCELLLEYEADVDHADRGGRTPLWAASSMGHSTVVKLLLFWGCYVDSIDPEGRTVLSVAAAQGGTDVVSQLLDRGNVQQAVVV